MQNISSPVVMAPFRLERVGSQMLVIHEQSGVSVAAPLTYEPFFLLIDGKRSFADILFHFRRQGGVLRFRELSELLQSLSQKGFLVQGFPEAPSDQASNPAKDYQEGGHRLLASSKPHPQLFSKGGFVLSLALGAALGGLSAIQFAREISYFDFLGAISNPFALVMALWAVVFANSVARALLLVILSLFGLGRRPNVRASSFHQGFLLRVSPEELMGLSRPRRVLLWIVAGLSPFVLYGGFSFFVGGALSQFVGWVSCLQALWLFNPFRDSDFNRTLNALVSPEEWRHLIPYLKSRALVAFANQKKPIFGESRLILFGVYALGWLYLSISLCLDIMTANLGPWSETLTVGDSVARLRTVLVLGVWGGLTGAVLFQIGKLLFATARSSLRGWELRRRKIISKKISMPTAQQAASQLKDIPFFDSFTPEECYQLVQKSQIVGVDQGYVVMSEGEVGHEMYVVLSGAVRVSRELATGLVEDLAELRANAIFGELALLKDVRRTADVEAIEDSCLLKIHRSAFDSVPHLGSGSISQSEVLGRRVALSRALTHSSFFKDCPGELTNLFFDDAAEFLSPKVGEIIIQEGQKGDDLYIVVQGKVTVSKAGRVVADLVMGDFFGEMTLLQNERRAASVVAGSDCLLLKVPAPTFFKILTRHWSLALNVDLLALMREETLR